MTIAAGFLHKDGILLCADTEQQQGAMKSHGSKIVQFDWKGRIGAFALAGNTDFALTTIQKCKTKLESTSSLDAIKIIEDILDKEYRRVVFKHPDYSTDYTLRYWLLAVIPAALNSVGLGAVGTVVLLKSNENTLQKIDNFSAVGIGDTFARHVIGPSFFGGMTERRTLYLASYMLNLVKKNVPGCSGWSEIISLRHDGTVGQFDDPATEHIEKYAGIYAMLAQDLMFDHLDDKDTDEAFETNLGKFVSQIRSMRKTWHERHQHAFSSMPRD